MAAPIDPRSARAADSPETPSPRRGGLSLLLTGVADIWGNVRAAGRATADLRGLALMVLSAACFALMAAIAKAMLPHVPTQSVVLSRAVIMTIVFLGMALAKRVSVVGVRPHKLMLRGLLGYLAVSCYFYSVQHIPLGDAVLLQYSHPVFVAVLAPLLLHERTGRWHWPLVVVALAGVAFIVGPSGTINREASVGLFGSVLSGFAYLTVRDLAKTEHPLTVLVWFSGVMIPGALIMSIRAGAPALPTNLHDWIAHVAVATAGLVGQFALTEGLARAGAARATAVTMTGPIFGLAFDVMFFDKWPKWTSVVGTLTVVVALMLLALNRPRAEVKS